MQLPLRLAAALRRGTLVGTRLHGPSTAITVGQFMPLHHSLTRKLNGLSGLRLLFAGHFYSSTSLVNGYIQPSTIVPATVAINAAISNRRAARYFRSCFSTVRRSCSKV